MTDAATLARSESGKRAVSLLAGVAVLLLAGCSEGLFGGRSGSAVPERPAAEAELLHRLLIAEDARASTLEALSPLFEGLMSESAEARRLAVRALGRMERESLIRQISPLLADPDPAVRAEAANALAQSVQAADPAAAPVAVRAILVERLEAEPHEGVRGAIAQSVARTRHASAAEVATTARAIVQAASGESVAPGPDPTASGAAPGSSDTTASGLAVPYALRAAKGLYLLARQPAARGAFPEEASSYLRGLLGAQGSAAAGDATTGQRTRTLALAALVAGGRPTPEDLTAGLADPEPLVRREAILAASGLGDGAAARALLARGLEDPSPSVRYDAVRGWGGIARDQDCSPIASAARDADSHVALLAIDLLAGCRSLPGVGELLDSLVRTARGSAPVAAWHRPAHALVSLAAIDSALATERMLPFVANENHFVRAYAASAAGTLREATTLRLLARDRHPNVRVAALQGLARIDDRGADDLLIEQLSEDDPQLVMTAASLLTGTQNPSALPALLEALDRFTTRRRETERDARVALLERIEELGSDAAAARLTPLLQDYDPEVAGRAAATLTLWTGSGQTTSPQPLPPSEVPTPAALDSLERNVFTIEMSDGSSFEVRLRAWDAPTNARRFARLAESGYFEGLTYHRVVPNFVVQGGSPNANEYSGDGPFTRDELGLDGNWRGTIGLSTRGRDTGDGQMFLNLVDNTRLDHEYTVFAEVVSGMDVVDRLLEGATIRRVRRTSAP